MPRINDKLVKALEAPAKGLRFAWDDAITGFGVRVTKAGGKSFVFRYVATDATGGKRERLFTIGPWRENDPTTLTASAARDEADRLASRWKLEKVGPFEAQEAARAVAQSDADRPDIAGLCADYIERHAEKKKRPKSYEEDWRNLASTVLPKLGTKKVADVSVRDIEDIMHDLARTPIKANRILSLLSKLFSLAVKWQWRNDNPCKGVERNPENKRERWLDNAEIGRLAEALEAYGAKNHRAADAIRLTLLTGSRTQEIFTAEWAHIDFERGVWVKPSTHTKQKKTEHVPLSAPAMALLSAMYEKADGSSPFLFPGNKPGQPITDLGRAWETVCKNAKISSVRLYDLRHSFASHLVSSGLSLEIIGRLMGHTQAATTRRYAHLADSPLREAAERMGAIVGAASERKPSAEIVPLPKARNGAA